MDKLWAPWRVNYLRAIGKKQKGCVFCLMQKSRGDKRSLIFSHSQYSFAVLNLYPYNNGHVLVMPKRHVADLLDLSSAEKIDLFDLLERVQRILKKVLQPEGFNIGINLGKAAGAGFPGHLHIHIVPRWTGDVNFMPVIANTKVVSQSLRVLYDLLIKAQET